jgi:hypothetical protein
MAGHETVLKEIKPDDSIVSQLITRLEANLVIAKTALNVSLAQDEYSGADTLGFNTYLLKWKNKISSVLPHDSVAQLYKKILGNTPRQSNNDSNDGPTWPYP